MTAHTDPTTAEFPASQCVIVLTTLPADADAGAFGEALVTERLAACVSIGAEMTSVFAWKGAVERARERQLLVKTVRRRSRSSRPGSRRFIRTTFRSCSC